LHQLEVVMKAAAPDKDALLRSHELRHTRSQPCRQHLSHQLSHTVNQADGAEVYEAPFLQYMKLLSSIKNIC
jgi:hypothetical protein